MPGVLVDACVAKGGLGSLVYMACWMLLGFSQSLKCLHVTYELRGALPCKHVRMQILQT